MVHDDGTPSARRSITGRPMAHRPVAQILIARRAGAPASTASRPVANPSRARRPWALAVAAAVVATCLAPFAPARAQGGGTEPWPTRPVRIVVGYAAGGPMDLLARIVADKLTASLGQSFVVENRPGANGAIAAGEVARAAPDGYTLIAVPSSAHAVNPNLTKLSWDPQRDFTPIAMIGNVTTILVVNPKLPVDDVQGLVAYARARPGRVTYGSPGRGSNLHLAGEMMRQMSGIDIVHVPYKGAAPALQDLIAGQIDMMFENVVTTLPHIQAGRVKPLAIAAAARSAQLPQLPTVAESGLPGFAVNAWGAVLGPAGLPAPIVTRLNDEIRRIVNAPEVRDRLVGLGVEPWSMTPAQTGEFVRAERERWAQVIRDAKLVVE